MSDNKKCRSCGEDIPSSAIKCRHCGSYQNFRRHLEFGNSAIALIIALISVIALSASSITDLLRAILADPLKPIVQVKILDLKLDEIRLLINNTGKSRIFFKDGALCRIPTVKPGVQLVVGGATLVRYPEPSEVQNLYAVFYQSAPEGHFIDPGASIVISAGRTSVLREDGRPFRPDAAELRAYCFISYIGQDGSEIGDFVATSAISAHSVGKELLDLPEAETINSAAQSQEDSSATARQQ